MIGWDSGIVFNLHACDVFVPVNMWWNLVTSDIAKITE
jgi:hypothetical protein